MHEAQPLASQSEPQAMRVLMRGVLVPASSRLGGLS